MESNEELELSPLKSVAMAMTMMTCCVNASTFRIVQGDLTGFDGERHSEFTEGYLHLLQDVEWEIHEECH